MAWRYACNIPTYITGKDENGEPVVLYRVNVFFQQGPDGGGSGSSNGTPATDSAPFFVLRRYSQFRHLHDQLKAAFPAAMSARGMAPPPKHPLVLGDKRDALERRRQELERWLWRLVARAEVARGPQLKAFLELDKALARAQQQQQRRRLEQQQRSLLDDGLPLSGASDFPGGSKSGTAPPSESGYGPGPGSRHHNLGAYPGGGGGASVLGDDSASDMSGPSGAASTAGAPPSLVPAAAAAGASGGPYVMPPDPRVASTGRGNPELRHHVWPHEPAAAAHGGGDAAAAAAIAASGAGAVQAARLGIKLASRADVRRLVDVLVQRLDAACSETAAAVSEAAMLRDANRAMAERLGELEVERAEAAQGPAAEAARAALAESAAARTSLEQRVAQLDETMASRSAAHAQQVSQLQGQLSEARTDNMELLRRLQEWDVGGNTATALAAQQRADELQQQLDEQRQRADEQRRLLDELQRQTHEQDQQVNEQRRRADELQLRLDEQVRCRTEEEDELQRRLQQLGRELEERGTTVDELQGRLREQERQLAEERSRREQAEAAVVQQQHQPPPPPPQHKALLDRARSDNALLAQEVQRLRSAAAAEREVHKTQLAAHGQATAQLAARVRELEVQLAAAATAAAAVPVGAQTQDLLLL